MMATFKDLNALDDWLLGQALEQAEGGMTPEQHLVPEAVARRGQPYCYLYATAIFEGEVANGGVQQFFENASGALAPMVRDGLRDMMLTEYSEKIGGIIEAFGTPFPRRALDRLDRVERDPQLQMLLDRAYDAIDVWSREYIMPRDAYARKCGLLK